MGYVFRKNNRWYVRYTDGEKKRRDVATSAESKAEAKRLLLELELKAERVKQGLEIGNHAGGTVAALFSWWLDTYSSKLASHERNVYTVGKHFQTGELASIALGSLRSAHIENFLQKKAREFSPETVNHLRRFLLTAINCAKRAGRFSGPNPALEVRARKVPKRKPDYLRNEEVPRVIAALDPRFRPLFAAAIYTGMRKGELFALRKRDVDFELKLISISRSHDRDTTKGGHADFIPIADALVPFLETACETSPSELVFPNPDGTPRREDHKLHTVLRRALGRAGITLGYTHVCRRCRHEEQHDDREGRRCPACNMKLWPKALVRPIRFHDLRHTTASLLMMAGVNPAAVQRILRHTNPKITMDVYGHLAPSYLRDEINRLRFQLPQANDGEAQQDADAKQERSRRGAKQGLAFRNAGNAAKAR